MYEDLSAQHLKKGDEDDENEDSGTWSYSYPSYSRFTFTGKTKSRLGRSHNRLNQPTAGRDNSTRLKGNNENSVLSEVDTFNFGSSSQAPKTPGMSWLQKDKVPSSNNFTPGSSLFKQSTAAHDSKISCNDSGVDVSSQSNFLFSLKNDSVQNSGCKRNLSFNTPFKVGENIQPQQSSYKELSHLFHQNSFPKLKFTDENKENAIIEQNSGQATVKDPITYDVFQNKVKHTSDKDNKRLSPAALDDHALKTINSEKVLDEPDKPLCAPVTDDQKIEDESSNTPIDLSSSKCLTHDNIFSRSFQSEKEPNSEKPKEMMNKVDIISKDKGSSDGLSSILPKFLAPVFKSKVNDVASTTFSDLPGTTVNVGKATTTCPPAIQNEIQKPTLQVVSGASSRFSSNIYGTNCFKPSSAAGEPEPISNHGHFIPKPISKEPLASKFLRKNNEVLISNKDLNENAASKNCDQLSSIINLSNCRNDKIVCSAVSSKPSKTKMNPNFQPLNHLSGSNLMNSNSCKSNNEFPVKNHVEDRLKALAVNCETNQDYKGVPIATMNSAVSNVVSCPDPPNVAQIKSTHHLNFNSRTSIPQSLSPDENVLSLKKSPHDQPQLSYDNQPQSCTIEPRDPFNHRVAKECRLPPQNQSASVNQDHFVISNEPVPCFQQGSEISQQKTFLAPQQSSELKLSNDFPHVKPDAPQLINNRLNCQAVKKPQNFKMSAPRGGLLSRSNTELYVNGKVYTTLSMLGRGGSSEVYQVLDQRSSKLMAVKCVDLSMVDKTIAEGYLNEIDLLSKLQGCSSVIRMFDYEYVQEYKMLYVVMEKGDTDLSQLIRDISKTKKISMSMIIYYWTEMLTAVRDIHEKGIIHSDLKPANFLLVSGRLKLIDFGIASSQGDMTSVFKEVTTGTWNYMSPEAIKNSSASAKGFKITYKSDVWSLGCILYNLLYGKTPFSHITSTWSKLQAIADPTHQIEFPEVGAPLVLAAALQSCLRREPKLRPTVAELLSLPYHASGDSRHLAPQLRSILPHEWWTKISHLFQEIKVNEEEKNIAGNAR